MDSNIPNIDETKNNNTRASDDNVEGIEVTNILISNTGPQATGHVYLQNANNAQPPTFNNTNKKQEKNKKEFNQVNVSGYLKSEISGLQSFEMDNLKAMRLPPYRARNTPFFRRCVNKPSKAYVHLQGKIRNVYSLGTFSVHFSVMGSEAIPEDKVIMVYEPETRNFTVKGMFIMLSLLHLFTCFFAKAVFVTGFHEGLTHAPFGLLFIPALVIFIMLGITVACFQYMRQGLCPIIACFLAFLMLGVVHGVLSCFFATRIFMFMDMALSVTDIVLACLGCKAYDYTIKRLYCVALVTGAVSLTMIMPMMECVGIQFYYWTDYAKPDHIGTYLICYAITLGSLAVIVAEIQLLLDGAVELGENDYAFGAFLMYMSLVDYPIRRLRILGACDRCEEGEEE